jgi:Zn ribbon nucleic-acid-binding protein
MAARDRFTSEIICPFCNQKGVLHLSEEDHPYMRSPDRTVDKIIGNFHTSVSNGVQVSITCKECNTKFEY